MLRDKAVPLYYQIETILRRQILEGEFLPGSNLPSEDMLAESFQVSRITVRQALSLLEQDGLIVRQRGKGTFVSQNARSVESPKLTGQMEDLISMGIKTTTKVLDLSMQEVSERIGDRLRLGKAAKVLRIEKVRMVEEEPFSYVLNYLPPDIGEKITADDLVTKPLLMILEEKLGIRPIEAIQSIEATIADAVVAPLLQVRVGEPLLKAERTVFDEHQRPVEYVWVLYRADKYFFTVKLERRRSRDSVGWKMK